MILYTWLAGPELPAAKGSRWGIKGGRKPETNIPGTPIAPRERHHPVPDVLTGLPHTYVQYIGSYLIGTHVLRRAYGDGMSISNGSVGQ